MAVPAYTLFSSLIPFRSDFVSQRTHSTLNSMQRCGVFPEWLIVTRMVDCYHIVLVLPSLGTKNDFDNNMLQNGCRCAVVLVQRIQHVCFEVSAKINCTLRSLEKKALEKLSSTYGVVDP